jgi:hypothetical protein
MHIDSARERAALLNDVFPRKHHSGRTPVSLITSPHLS